jgi:hypothetical protein
MYVRGYLQGSENGRVVTIDLILIERKYSDMKDATFFFKFE